MRVGKAMIALAVAGAGVLFAVGSAAGAPKVFVGCGSTVYSSVTLTADLNCSGGGDGLEIGASGITINLNGHTITGAGGGDGSYGIYNDGYNDVTIQKGTIQNFLYGIYDDGAYRMHVSNVNIALDGNFSYDGGSDLIGIYLWYSYFPKISKVTVTSPAMNDGSGDNAYGVYLYRTDGSMVEKSTLTGLERGVYDWEGGYTGGCLGSTYSKNTLTGNDDGFYIYEGEYGFVTMRNNTSSNNSDDGAYLHEATCDGFGSTIQSNTFNSNGAQGMHGAYNYYMKFSRNTAMNNGSNGFNFWYPYGATLKGSTANNNGGDGFRLGAFDYTFVTGNTANDNSDNGFDMFDNDTCSGLFAKNSAFGNGDWSGFASYYFIPGTGNKGDGGFNDTNVAKSCI
jgi:parallel beta-helix repeat protein